VETRINGGYKSKKQGVCFPEENFHWEKNNTNTQKKGDGQPWELKLGKRSEGGETTHRWTEKKGNAEKREGRSPSVENRCLPSRFTGGGGGVNGGKS